MGKSETSPSVKTIMRFPSVRFSLAALAALALINGIFLFTSHTAQRQQLQRAQTVADSIDQQIHGAQSVLQNVAGAGLRMDPGDLKQVMEVTLRSTPYFADLAELPTGSGGETGSAGGLAAGRGLPSLQSQPDRGSIFQTPFLALDPTTGEASVYLAQRLSGGSVILGKLRSALLQTAVDTEKRHHPHEMIYLTDEKGLVLAHSGQPLEAPAALPVFSGMQNEPGYNAASIIVQNAQPNSQAVVHLQNAGWYVVSLAPLQGTYFPYLFSSLLMMALAFVWVGSDTRAHRLNQPDLLDYNLDAISRPFQREKVVMQALDPGAQSFPDEHEERALAEALRDTASVLNSSLNFDEVMSRILDNVGKVVPHHSSSVMLIEKDGDTVRIVAARGYTHLGLDEYSERLRLSIQNTYTLSLMYNSNQPLIVPDTAQDAHWFNFPESSWIRSYAAAPIKVKGRIIGFLNLNSPTAGFYQIKQGNRLLAFADQAGIAIENARLLQQLQDSNRELIKTYDITLQGWSKALELRDYETEGHSQRVVELTLKIAARMGIEEPELTHIRYGVLLHDIGKIGIPDAILFKPGPLTEDEWKTMRMHPQYALNILASIPYLAPAIDIPYNHHERWDGTGYPRGLMGKEIPMAARIFAIVDVWDGLRQSRPYHASWAIEEAIRYIKEESGKQFDPKVVEVFLQLIAEK